ncbi:MAG: YraN family protein [Candidatus Sericytochromatia bacterium]
MKEKNKRKKGLEGEKVAINFLLENNYEILENNFYCRYGEIDIVAKKENIIIFIEVKYRKNANFGEPEEAVSLKKIKAICKTALYYITSKELQDNINFRFDVISIKDKELKHIISAFDFIS